ncbi:MAG: nuclear transport factor 2 family protein [Bacteroidetes bacterium]|nr:nuclear transport factor 2 family protein [Bacteroidota bacterium]
MKNLLIVFVAILLSTGISAKDKNSEKEKEAIKKVITEATNAWVARDYEKISNSYLQEDDCIKINVGKAGFRVQTGWEEISTTYKNGFKNNPEPINRTQEKVNFKIRVYTNSAWSIHDEHVTMGNGNKGKNIITHFLEKHDKEWKVVYMSMINGSSYDVAE